MESDVIDPLTLLKGIAILTAIPVVGLALWSEYFVAHIQDLKDNDIEFELPEEIQRVRLASLTAMIFQMVLFMGTTETRRIYPIATTIIFAAAIFLQIAQQNHVERKLAPKSNPLSTQPDSGAQLGLVARAFLWNSLGAIAYVGILMLSLRTAFVISTHWHLSNAASIAWTLGGLLFGISSGLAFGFATGPFQFRRIFPTVPLEDPETREMIETCFKDNKLPLPTLWTIELDYLRSHNVLLAGFRSGRGPFRPALFISKPLLSAMTRGEFRAIILHEIGHLKKSHLRNRFIFSVGLVLATSLLAATMVLLLQLLMPSTGVGSVVGLVTMIAGLLKSFQILARQSRLQEFEADLQSLDLGASFEEIEGALCKIDQINGTSGKVPTRGNYPSTEERIQLLRAYWEKRHVDSTKEKEAA